MKAVIYLLWSVAFVIVASGCKTNSPTNTTPYNWVEITQDTMSMNNICLFMIDGHGDTVESIVDGFPYNRQDVINSIEEYNSFIKKNLEFCTESRKLDFSNHTLLLYNFWDYPYSPFSLRPHLYVDTLKKEYLYTVEFWRGTGILVNHQAPYPCYYVVPKLNPNYKVKMEHIEKELN